MPPCNMHSLTRSSWTLLVIVACGTTDSASPPASSGSDERPSSNTASTTVASNETSPPFASDVSDGHSNVSTSDAENAAESTDAPAPQTSTPGGLDSSVTSHPTSVFPSEPNGSSAPSETGPSPNVTLPLPDVTPLEVNRATLPSVRQEHGVAALNDEIYVLGGFTPSVTASVQAYSPSTETWRDVADFPELFHHPNVGAIDGKLYVAGFLRGSSLSTADGRVFAYDPGTNEWSPRSAMPPGTERGSACSATLGAKLYVFGGASRSTMPDASAYDTVTDTWEDLTFMPELREHCVAAAVDGVIYIVSGRNGGITGIAPQSFAYYPEVDRYEERAAIPTPRGGTAGALIYGHIFVFGGEGNPDTTSGLFEQIEAYDPSNDAWRSYPAMTIPRHGFGAAALHDRIYLPGGGTSQGFGATDVHTAFVFNR